MLRRSLVLSALLSVSLIAANGCQSCSSCHDYDPPVANCHSAYGPQCGCNGIGSNCGCNNGSCGNGPYAQMSEESEGAPVEGRPAPPQSDIQPSQQDGGMQQ